METFSALQVLCGGNPQFTGGFSPVTAGFPYKNQVMQSFFILFDECRDDILTNSRVIGDIRHLKAHVR